MRIALLIETLQGGGAEAVVRTLAAGLAQRGHDTFVYCLRQASAPLEELTSLGVTVREARTRRHDPLLPARLAYWFSQDGIELANSHNSAATVMSLPAAKGLRISLVQTRHGGLLGRPTRFAHLANLAGSLLSATTIVAESQRDSLPPGLARRAVYIANGLELESVAPREARQALERLCGRALAGPVVLSVGTICPEKDLCNLLRAFALLRLELSGVTLVHVGAPRNPAYHRLVQAQARRLSLDSHVVFCGDVAEPWKLMAGADVFCLASATEAMPLVVIEAMSQSVPIVATAVGAVGRLDQAAPGDDGPRQYLISHGVSGLLARPGEPHALAAALRQTLYDRRAAARRAQRALADYRKFFSSRPMVCAYEQLYLKLLKPKPAVSRPRAASAQRTKVLLVGPAPHQIGGMTSVIDALMAGPLARRYAFERYWPRGAGGANATGCRTALHWVRSIARHAAALADLARTIRRTRSQILHVHTCSFFSFYRSLLDIGLGKLLGCRTCLHVHGGRFEEFCAASGAVARWTICRGCELCDALIVLAPYWGARLRPFIGRAPVYAVPNGVELPANVAPPQARTQGVCRFLFLGALCAGKGLNELLAAAAQMRAAGTPFELILAGPAEPDNQMWPERVRDLGLETCVQFTGPVSGTRKAELLASADCLVLPSHQEGLPMVLLEAGAAGLPVIATSVGAIPEFLSPRLGEPGFYAREEMIAPIVPPGDVIALVREMTRLALEPSLRQRIGGRLQARVREGYTSEHVAQRLSAIYDRLLGLTSGTLAEATPSRSVPTGRRPAQVKSETQLPTGRSRFTQTQPTSSAPGLQVQNR